MAIVVDASVGLKWVLQEPDSHFAHALVRIEANLLLPDFWLHEATNVLWLQVRRKLFTPEEAREGLVLLRGLIDPTPTAEMGLHEIALDIGITIDHSTYDTLYIAFALAMGASTLVAADRRLLQSMANHPDPGLSGMGLSLESWALSRRVIE